MRTAQNDIIVSTGQDPTIAHPAASAMCDEQVLVICRVSASLRVALV